MKRLLPYRVLVPIVLGMAVALAVLGFAEIGYQRLEFANRAMSTALEMETVVNQTLALVVDAESSQRGYLLTGDPSYLKPYEDALPRIERSFGRLRALVDASGTTSMSEHTDRLNGLIGRKLNDLEATLALKNKSGPEAALQLLDTGVGRKLTDQIRDEAQSILDELSLSARRGATRWTRDIEFGRVGMLTMSAFTLALLLVVWVLARRELKAREAKRRMMVEEHHRLEREVAVRTEELSELSSYLQTVREEEKSRLARDIHDELGGILVGAKMDVAWAAQRCKGALPDAADKLSRALTMLDEGVEMKRRIIEELRPTLLDNLGLAAALEWQARQTCERAGIACELDLDEFTLPPDVAIALFRVAQEALTNIVKHANARNVKLRIARDEAGVMLSISDDGGGMPSRASPTRLSHGMAGMRQRVRAFDGRFTIRSRVGSGTTIETFIPLEPDLAEETHGLVPETVTSWPATTESPAT